MRILLVTPPMVQVNAPYPAVPLLAGVLEARGVETIQQDAAQELALRLFSKAGIKRIRKALRSTARGAAVRHFLMRHNDYAAVIEPAIRFLQGRDPTLALRIASRGFLPEGPRFQSLDAGDGTLATAFGPLATHDMAMHLASLFIDTLADVIHDGVDDRFALSRYGETLAASAPTFDGLAAALRRKPTLIDTMIDEIAAEAITAHRPDLVGFTLPFPGNVYGAFRMARVVKQLAPATTVVMGGGYVNTELRGLSDPRVFDYTDFITLDDGEGPLLHIIEHLDTQPRPPNPRLERTFFRKNNRVRYIDNGLRTTDYGLQTRAYSPSSVVRSLSSVVLPPPYFSMIEMLNPMHRIWSCGQWNKLTLAHGCYWKQCAFCDTTLDYICSYAPTPVPVLIERIESMIAQTGQTGFHFTDEAMPPALLRALAGQLIARGIQITWWGNIRFDKAFTPELTQLLAKSGCVAVTGGLEAATDRLLKLMNKGFSLDQATRVTRAFAEAGILAHAYLMYGCPSETEQDTIDSLDYVRQLFEAGCLQSAYWHRFALTVHSPIFKEPKRFGLRVKRPTHGGFALNEVPFVDSIVCDHEAMGRGLRKALYNYMHGVGFDLPLQDWFDVPVPPPTLPTNFVHM